MFSSENRDIGAQVADVSLHLVEASLEVFPIVMLTVGFYKPMWLNIVYPRDSGRGIKSSESLTHDLLAGSEW